MTPMLSLRLSMESDIDWSADNMLNSLKKKFLLLYTCSTGLILTAVLIFVLIITNEQLLKGKKDTFLNNFTTVSKNVQMDNVISHLWLSELEIKNHLIIHIEDNGKALLYKGAWQTPTERETLFDRLKDLAQKDNINTNIRPISLNEVQSKIYDLKGNKNDRYLGAVSIVPAETGYRSVVMLQYISGGRSAEIKQLFFILFADISGITALFFVSRWIVGKSLKPVEESRKQQTEFIAAASHELKSPLAVIRANASALMIEPDRMEHFAKGIDKECWRLSSLIEDMLLLASADAKRWHVKKEIIDMDILFIETYDLFFPYCREQGKNLKLELQEDMLPKTEGDIRRLKQILAVLIDNAAAYTKERDTIILRGYSKRNRLWMEVEDHGPGIADAKKKEVFERFYREDKSRKDKNHFGLGLSIARELAELHGGNITLKDTAGGGATFSVCIPAARSV